MADRRFFIGRGPFRLGELAELAGARLSPGADETRLINDVAPLDVATPDHISFFENPKYAALLVRTSAGAICLHPDAASRAPTGAALLLSGEPYKAYALIAQAFYPEEKPSGIRHPSAVVDPTADIGAGTDIGACAVIGARASIGVGCAIGAGTVIGPSVVIGDFTQIGPNVTLSHAVLGKNIRIYPGTRIGQDGFGYALGSSGVIKVPQLGRVIVGDGAEIGANVTIDRGAGPDTVIGPGCIIDNLVQIGHNVELGRGCVLVAQVGISGSTKVDDFVQIGGQSGLTGHLRIGAGAQIAGQSGVMRDVPPGGKVGGYPAVPLVDWHRQTVALARLAKPRKQQ